MRVAKQVSRMKRRHHLDAKIVVKMATEFADRQFGFEQILGGGRPENDDHFWPDNGDLTFQKRFAGQGFIRLGSPIARRAAAVDIADKNVFASEANALDDLGKQLSGTPDERETLFVLICSRSLTAKHQICVEIAGAVDDLRAAQRTQFASCAIRPDLGPDLLDGFGWLGQ